MTGNKPLLQVRNLKKYYPVYSHGFRHKIVSYVKACDDVSFDLQPGETLGLVGESGCGKSTTARAILRAITPTGGEVLFNSGKISCDLAKLPPRKLKAMRPHMQMIFQDPFSSLNPRMTIGNIVGEPLKIHRMARGSEYTGRVDAMLERVGLKPEHKGRYPHAFSGGQRQRIGIARALIMNPSLIIADEAVSALDVSVQAQIINLLDELQTELHLTTIFVAHDLSVVKHICDRVAVMYAGKIVEMAGTKELFADPHHPYTMALLSAVPEADPDKKMNFTLSGEVADPGKLPEGCSFHPRCAYCINGKCNAEKPVLTSCGRERSVACHWFNKNIQEESDEK